MIPGTFASVRRQWKSGDRIDLELPLKNRLEPINARHANMVALLCGPLVLFAITDGTPAVTRAQLLAARKVGEREWEFETGREPLKLLPFTAIADEPYSTYMSVS